MSSDKDMAPKEREPTEEEKQRVQNILDLMKRQNISPVQASSSTAESTNDNTRHAFWDTQPMLSLNEPLATIETQEVHQPIVPDKPKTELRQTPFNMPKGFMWSDVDITDPTQKQQVYELLNKNYVEDDDCMFRFDYSLAFIEWALTPPGFKTSFHLGVRSVTSNKLVAFISAIPATIRAYEKKFKSVEINFLCVHKKLRSKRLAPVLIKEITRRVNHSGIFQAVYTAGVVLPGPVSSCRYYHRTLNAPKLVDIGFTRVPPRTTLARMCKQYKLPNETNTPGLCVMEDKHFEGACQLLRKHLDKFNLVVNFTTEDFAYWFKPRKDVISSYVIVDENGSVTDMISYYHLHSSLIGNANYSHLNAAYSFYNVATSVDLESLMRDALILAKGEGMDVFNALEQMDNIDFLSSLKFGKGDGNLQYYLYNWCCPTMESKDVGIVLL